jgi:hypothetical protein
MEGTKSSNHDCTKDGGAKACRELPKGTRYPHRIPRRRRAAPPAGSRNRIEKPQAYSPDPGGINKPIQENQIKRKKRTWASTGSAQQSRGSEQRTTRFCCVDGVWGCELVFLLCFLMAPSSFVRSNAKAGEGRAARPKSSGPASTMLVYMRSERKPKPCANSTTCTATIGS